MCMSPMSIQRPSGRGSSDRITVPCGKCFECLKMKRNHWSFRLEQEFRHSTSAFFVTLTYSDENVRLFPYVGNDSAFESLPRPLLPGVNKRDVQLFLKRLRKSCSDSKIRYYITSEYGGRTLRPHYHGILFGLPGSRDSATDVILRSWGLGHVQVGSVTSASISYCTKYCITKDNVPPGHQPTFSLMSTKPGLGASYLDTHSDWHNSCDEFNYVVRPGGQKLSIPKYYSDRMFDDRRKEDRLYRCIASSDSKPLFSPDNPNSKLPLSSQYRIKANALNSSNKAYFKSINKLDKL